MTEENNVEAEAKAMGWAPKEEFRGDESNWIPAEKFVERAKSNMPIMKENLERALGKIDGMASKIGHMENVITEFKKHNEMASKNAYKQAEAKFKSEINTLKAQLREAAKDGDVESYDRIERDITVLESSKPEPPVEPTQNQSNAGNPDVAGWMADNPWFNTDPTMRQYALSVEKFVAATTGLPDGRALYDKITEEVKAKFPDKFSNPNRTGQNTVEGGGQPPMKTTKKTYKDLPDEARQACDLLVSEKVLTREKYLQDYFGEEA